MSYSLETLKALGYDEAKRQKAIKHCENLAQTTAMSFDQAMEEYARLALIWHQVGGVVRELAKLLYYPGREKALRRSRANTKYKRFKHGRTVRTR